MSLELQFIELRQLPQLNHIESGYLQLLTTNSLIKSSVIFTSMRNILLQHDIVMTPPRMNDCFIMESIGRLQITYKELLACNHCCIYLCALFLSDITTGNGTMI
jgi:hypothetical protein